MISFNRPRIVLPVQNYGLEYTAQRKVAESAERAAKKTQNALKVDSFQTRLWLRNPRGSVQCVCSSQTLNYSVNGATPLAPPNSGKIILDSGQGDDLDLVDSGYPLGGQPNSPNKLLPEGEHDFVDKSTWIDSIGKLLMGDGRRCALCWGTGWIDGHRMWGGQRFICCSISTPWTTVDPASECQVDLDTPTPTFVGPGTITWELQSLPNLNILDAFRIRCGEFPADSEGWTLTVFNSANPGGIDYSLFLGAGIAVGQTLAASAIPTKLTLTLQADVRVSHIEMVMRSEPLINVQLPNLTLTASTELVQPFIQEEFEVDPKIAWLERGSIFEIPGIGGRLGSVWLVQDVIENRTAQGFAWNITGSARNVQPNEIYSCVSMEDALSIGIMDYGLGIRGLESTGDSEPSGLGNQTDEGFAVLDNDGDQPRMGGGTSTFSGTITLTPTRED